MSEQPGRREVVKLTRAKALELMRAGQEAKAAGEPATACPYSPAGNATERVSVQAWLRGYLRGPKREAPPPQG
jgi:hypothetical protein